eukprot:CAMPEP_0114054362 /NCGR_PEP_ID=MMETSP1339-20121228/85576_1 /TAXON_ID=94617 /ORGANISM="Fibrocapsa japonica" /LENGTH=44 /assembly_acc=CAM_ASM_000762
MLATRDLARASGPSSAADFGASLLKRLSDMSCSKAACRPSPLVG